MNQWKLIDKNLWKNVTHTLLEVADHCKPWYNHYKVHEKNPSILGIWFFPKKSQKKPKFPEKKLRLAISSKF